MKKQMSVMELVLDMVGYYRTHPRGTVSGYAGACTCFNEETGAMCAVGRCLADPSDWGECSVGDMLSWDEDDDEYSQYGLDHLLKPEYMGHTNDTWTCLQNLHDDSDYWEKTNEGSYGWGQVLTDKGRDKLNELFPNVEVPDEL